MLESGLEELPEWEDAEKEIKKELKRDGNLTWEEVKEGLGQWEKETGKKITDEEWAMVEAGFKMADLNGNGSISKKEWKCVTKGKGCPDGGAELMLHEVTEEQWEWIGNAIIAELEKDGDISMEDLVHGIAAFEKHFDVKAHQGHIDAVVAMFHYADKNGDGKVTIAELTAEADKHKA